MPPKYRPIPISAAKEIAQRFAKDQVIVVTWDAVHGREHVTTYGIDVEQCRQAALGGDRVKTALGWVENPPVASKPKPKKPRRVPATCRACWGSGQEYRQDNASGPGVPGKACRPCLGKGTVLVSPAEALLRGTV